MFVNILAVRNYPSPEKTFKQFLQQVKQCTLDAYENQDYQFEDLVDKLSVKRDTSRNPILDVTLNLVTHTGHTGSIPALENKNSGEHMESSSKFDLSLIALDYGQRLLFSLRYCTKLFKANTIKKFIKHFKKLISQLPGNINSKISDIEIITGEEKQKLLYEFNNTGADYPREKTIHELFAEQVEKIPHQTAVVFENRHLTYKNLHAKTSQLARILRKKGVKPDTLTAVMVECSVEMIVSILGILKAGGAYVPIDTRAPGARILSILEDSNASLLLTQSKIIENHSFFDLKGIGSQPRETAANRDVYLTNPRPVITHLDRLPFPNRSLVNYEKYHRYIGQSLIKHSISMLGTRGCPFHCAYCHKIWPDKQVTRSAENIFAEVQLYYNMGIRRFVFLDDVFNLNVKNTRKFFQLIDKHYPDLQLFLCLRGDILTKDYIDLMVKAGTLRMALALETASPRLQKLIGKNLNLEKFRENIEYISKKYPQVILELNTMHGFPTETEAEARMTLEFIKSLKWIHFPYINILKIYQDTNMEKLALENGISAEAISDSANLAYHELPATLPFDKSFTLKYQAEFLEEYFLSKERLLHVLPYQARALTEDELVQKYNSYLPVDIRGFDDLLEFTGISKEELAFTGFVAEESFLVPRLNEKLKQHFNPETAAKTTLKVLLLDLSQLFTTDAEGAHMLYDVVEAPLGLMYIMSCLEQQFGNRITGKIAKSRIDFENYDRLKALLEAFQPDVIGIRTLTYYREFFHRTVAMIRHWGIEVPVIVGGPYATSDYKTILQDGNVDLAVLGEGEITFAQLIRQILENEGKLPGKDLLKKINGLALPTGETGPNSGFTREILMLDVFNQELSAKSHDHPAPINQPTDLAYTIFTSGSTGKPKGVMLEHRNVINLVTGLKERIYKDYTGTLKLGMVSPYVFDASVKQVFGTLLQGHSLYIVPEDTRIDGRALLQFYRKHQIDISDGTPAHLRLLLENININDSNRFTPLGQVKHFIIGGEALPGELVRSFLKILEPSPPIITNVYGPTECCVDATSFQVVKECLNLPGDIPIGRVMPNYRVYILDSAFRLQPLGTAGELCIAGAGVARGYLNKPELTNEKFCLRPPGGKPMAHGALRFAHSPIYRTGDLAKWLPQGNLLFLGRTDKQVKIRGYRIEPGEIETQLCLHDSIKEALVLAKKDSSGDKYLCAYVVTKKENSETGNTSIDISEIKTALSKKLPGYMIPSFFLELDQIPLTSNGKIDRKALPGPVSKVKDEYIPPGDDTEKKLAALWSEVLNIPQEVICLNSNFFELGGHSLKAATLTSRLHKELDLKIHLADIFKAPTIRELAGYIKEVKKDRYLSIKPVEKKEYQPLSSAQKRLYLLQQMDLNSTGYNMTTALTLKTDIDKRKLEITFKKLISRHESLRTSFEMVKHQPVQRIHDHVDFEIQYRELSAVNRYQSLANNEENASVGQAVIGIIEDFVRPFDLSKAPLLKIALIKVKTMNEKNILVYDLHHIITDGISQDTLAKEFMMLYEDQELSPIRLQYNDFSNWQNSRQQQELIKQQETYWLKLFSGELPVLNLPTDYPGPFMQNFQGNSVSFRLSKEDTKNLKNLAVRENATLYMYIMAVFAILLSKQAGEEDIIIGTPTAGRNHIDVENIVGNFINTIPIRSYPSGRKTFKEFLKEVRTQAANAFQNQDYPFDSLVDRIAVDRDINRNPIFNVVFNLLDQGEYSNHLPDSGETSDSEITTYKNLTSKFDISLIVINLNDNLLFSFEYYTSLFKEDTMHFYFKNMEKMIKQVTRDKEIKIKDIELMDEGNEIGKICSEIHRDIEGIEGINIEFDI
jgi:amino acid adenylation domain-containing protein